MDTPTNTFHIPLAAIKPLYRNDQSKTLVLEVPIEALLRTNEPETLDELIVQARLDYASGDYQGFSNVEDLIRDLRS